MTRFWHRRICEATFFVAVVVIALYVVPLLPQYVLIGHIVTISLPACIVAGITALTSIILYVWAPKKIGGLPSLVVFILLATTTSLLILGSGTMSSPFIALLMITAIFAGVFGISGYVVVLAAIGSVLAGNYLQTGTLSTNTIVMALLISVVPLLVSFLIWHNKSAGAANDDRAYKDLANELSEVASKSEVVINAIGDGVMAVDNQGIIQLINPAAQTILGWGKQDALALSYKSVLQLVNQKGDPLDATTDPIQQVLNTNQQLRTNDFTIITKSAKKLLTSLVISPIGTAGSGAIIVFRDITKEKAEEREQAEFISTASHEMRTPVASIEGYLGLALNPATAQIDAKARDFILKAHESAQHLGRLFQDLLDVSKADDGRLSNNPRVVDVMTFTHDIVQGLQPKAAEKGLRLTFKPIPDDNVKHMTPVYSVNLDNDHIREIINNLTENAIKYTPSGEVVVDVTGTEDKVVISIQDSGIGIPAEDMPHLFQKFYRVDNVDTRQIGGTGLGLYLCRRLAETMGGRIWAESEYKKGSTFYVELPRLESQEASRLAEQQAADAARTAATPPPAAASFTVADGAAPNTIQPASTVPRGESLTPEQIAQHVARLRAMAQEQSASVIATPSTAMPPPQVVAPTVATRSPQVTIPVRDPSQPTQ